MRRMIRNRTLRALFILAGLIFVADFFGLIKKLNEKDYYTEFEYPLEGDIEKYREDMERGVKPSVTPFPNHDTKFKITNEGKCDDTDEEQTASETLPIRIVYLVKSAVSNFKNRNVIRKTWGYERRFADVQIRTVFLLGSTDGFLDKDMVQEKILHENEQFHDIVQGDFVDAYYNNTIKTLMGLRWAVKFCPNSRFYVYVDDDYYVSTRNVLRFLRNPSNYPKYLQDPTINFDDVQETNKQNANLRKGRMLRELKQNPNSTSAFNRKLQQLIDFDLPVDVELYAGYVYFPSPLRHKSSKWYMSLEEYPYNKYPPYVTAGAYVLSNVAVKKFFYASYFVKKFRFDDVYLGIIAKKLNIEPFHSEEFWFHRKYPYKVKSFRYTIASHEFSNPVELEKVWNEQKQAGNA